MKQAQPSQPALLLTLKDHAVKIGSVDLRIPRGTAISDCLEDAQLFFYVAGEALEDVTDDMSPDSRMPVSALRCVRYTLSLAAAMHAAAHSELLSAGLLHAERPARGAA